MDETKIRRQLGVEQQLVDMAKSAAEASCYQETAELLDKAKRCKDVVYGLLMEAEPDENGLARMTCEVPSNMERTRNHPFAKDTQRIYSEGEKYCMHKLQRICN